MPKCAPPKNKRFSAFLFPLNQPEKDALERGAHAHVGKQAPHLVTSCVDLFAILYAQSPQVLMPFPMTGLPLFLGGLVMHWTAISSRVQSLCAHSSLVV